MDHGHIILKSIATPCIFMVFYRVLFNDECLSVEELEVVLTISVPLINDPLSLRQCDIIDLMCHLLS
jgi:hypothetical protein